MNRNIIKIPLKGVSRKDWLKLRDGGIGGSDVGSIFGIDRFKPAIKLFHQKIGFWDSDEEDNIQAYGGRVGEDFMYNKYWKFLNPENKSEDELLMNANNNNVIRKARSINSMLKNPKYPWLLANIDREISKYGDKGNGVLELKKPSSMHWNIYSAGLPPSYILQCQMYLIVTEYKFSELFALKDGTYPELFIFNENAEIQQAVITKTKVFWDKVLEGRKIVQNKSLSIEEKTALLAPLEPEPESSEAYETYMKDRFKKDAFSDRIPSTKELETIRNNYWIEHERKTNANKDKQLEKNKIMDFMVKNRVNAVETSDEKLIKMVIETKISETTIDRDINAIQSNPDGAKKIISKIDKEATVEYENHELTITLSNGSINYFRLDIEGNRSYKGIREFLVKHDREKYMKDYQRLTVPKLKK